MMKSFKTAGLYWAVPVWNWQHRNIDTQNRIVKFMSFPKNDLRSCYYHIGDADIKSIFFISDTAPITEKYISKEYIGKYTEKIYIIKNKILIEAIVYKLKRILSFESTRPNYFRQHITDIKNYLIQYLIQELNKEK